MGSPSGTTSLESVLPGEASSRVPKRQLSADFSVSEVIKGCWQLAGVHKGNPATDRTAGRQAVEDFARFEGIGVTTFDTADIYGPSEELIGQYVKQRPSGAQGLQILTKCCKFGSAQLSISSGSISNGIKQSLKRLGVPSLDLVQFYWHDYSIPRYVDAALYLMDEVSAGRIKHLGVTNFDVPRIEQMVNAGAEVVSSQVQYSLLDQRPENAMVGYCAAHNIKLLPFGTVAGGLLTEKALGSRRLDLDTVSKSKYASIIERAGGFGWYQSLLTTLHEIAQKHSTSIANVASRWVLDKDLVAGVIVGARNALHVKDHAALQALNLDNDDRVRIMAVLDEGAHPRGDVYDWERGGAW